MPSSKNLHCGICPRYLEYEGRVWIIYAAFAEYVWRQRERFSGAAVVEIGTGTSFPGLTAATLGSEVTLTDDSNRSEVLGLTWGVWDEFLFSLKPKIILGADELYEARLNSLEMKNSLPFALISLYDLFATVTFLLQNSPGLVFITTYHNRSGHHLIEFLMVKWGLKCVKLLDGFSFMPSFKTNFTTTRQSITTSSLLKMINFCNHG